MKKMLLLFGMLFTLGISTANAQEAKAPAAEAEREVVSHTVAMGETVMLISKKYLVKPQDIYDMNPSAVNGISPNSVLRIPVSKSLRAQQKMQPAKVKRTESLAIKTENSLSAAH